jgi:hypothetical protein
MSLRAQKRTPRPAPHIIHCTDTGIYNYSTVRAGDGYELRSQNGIAVPVSGPIHARRVARQITDHLSTNPVTIPIPLDVRMPVVGGAK